MSRFNDTFKEVIEFFPDRSLVVSRREYTKNEAKKLYDKEIGADISLENIEQGWVKWRRTPSDLKDECLGDFCWLTCEESDRGAQPVWIYT